VEQIEREAVIVPEIASNSLIVTATRSLFQEIVRIIEEIDARPPMVMIQVLIAEVSLNDTDEFGVEIGIQDSVLFDRSLLEVLDTTLTTTTSTTPGGAVTTVETENIVSANITPGFAFLNPLTSLGNSAGGRALSTAGKVGTQGLSNLGVGRVNGELGFGGFVFSAGSENLNVLLRALQESRRLEVLSRPQIMALDNQFAIVQVGQRVPFIADSTITAGVQNNTLQFQEVGLILRVQPRVSPDGMVVMHIEAEKSDVGPEEEGIPLTTSATGEVVRVPRINRTFAGTTVHALSGQTIVLGGLISKEQTDVHRRVPLLADIPLLGDLFRYDGVSEGRNELLIIMTPRVVRNYLDTEMIKQVEASRMSWVLSDVIALHGPSGLRGRGDAWTDAECEVIYPTHVPADGEMVLPLEGQPQPSPAQPPSIEFPAQEQTPSLGRYEEIDNEAAAPAVFHGSGSGEQPVQQTAYEKLIPLPPTR
jgi:type II secretory pathway component GspD/PulD (secretin)